MILCALLAAAPAAAATLTPHASQADFQSALDPGLGLLSEEFDEFAPGTLITDQIGGVAFSSPNDGLPGFVPIQIMEIPGTSTPPNGLGGGYVTSGTTKQVIVLDLASPSSAFALFLLGDPSTLAQISLEFEFTDGGSQTAFVHNVDGKDDPIEFFGVTSDTPFTRVTITSNAAVGALTEWGAGYVPFSGLDSLEVAGEDSLPPICAGAPSEVAGVVGVDGTGVDDRAFDTGIAGVALEPGAVNITLSIDPGFMPGDPSISFRLEPSDPGENSQGTATVTDGAGNTCTLCLNSRALPGGPTLNEALCCDDQGIAFSVSNPDLTPSGVGVCDTSPISPAQPPFPFGYEEPLGEEIPCQVLTIDSPIAGLTDMTFIKDGPFNPELRLLATSSPDGGISFPPFEDVTLSVEPGSSKLKGKKQWSVVKVACAVLAEVCDGIDNDGDGEIDEGLPIGEFGIDQDEDGFPLCAAAGEAIDCNDQIATINPNATETCNGLDDNCDGQIDEGTGGDACMVPGLLGECANGTTSCDSGAPVCNQTVFPTPETCDGLDNDCDGVIDAVVAPEAVCSLSQSNFNVTSEAKAFKFNLESLVDVCDPGNPVPLDASAVSTAWISRVGNTVLPDPSTLACPDPINGILGETGIFENIADRQVTGNDVDLKFNLEADGDCTTPDGTRQEVFALLSDALDGSMVPICFTSTIDGVAFECCSDVRVTNTGNR